VFKNNIEKRIRSLPEIDGLSKETVLSSWMAKFDQIFRGDDDPRKRPQRQSVATSEMILTKEQLYDMFQNILGIKKYEHQILYNAMQVRILSCSRLYGVVLRGGNGRDSVGHLWWSMTHTTLDQWPGTLVNIDLSA